MTNHLKKIDFTVVLVLENRSFDQMLGYLYSADRPASVQEFDGLTGEESNADDTGREIAVYKIKKCRIRRWQNVIIVSSMLVVSDDQQQSNETQVCSSSCGDQHRSVCLGAVTAFGLYTSLATETGIN